MYPSPSEKFPYEIQPGDNYWLLAQRFSTHVDEIIAANPTVNPYYLFVGQVISIPFVQHSMPVSFTRPANYL
ncbi:LysM domain-containing protein [Brevibacillus laterosporus]|uniref:LysM domain-containing protein n=1 Tax=Brevibacillus laterosporus TaxID=1465 RepID=A0A502IMY0_BRELA|nr:LysM domain-containing protein [Brevibacillus laterosporus]QDX93180.1 LysM domain-containing protein [Brevibacillus laterosporus]TPG72918.1 LysM domain-containing protein [Brevibacillus laterosporus]TPG86876.1 LysM domain-containing protein [Brevibacillus laterosporus]